MTAEQKMKNILAQVRAAERGDTNVLNCPYCGGANYENHDDHGPRFCCDLMKEAAFAALERIRFEQAAEIAERAMERHQNN